MQIIIKVRTLEEHVETLSAELQFAKRSINHIRMELQALVLFSFLHSPSTPSEPYKHRQI